MLREQSDRRGWIVVTSDRSLGDQCRHLEARVERSDRFRPRLRDHAASEQAVDETDEERARRYELGVILSSLRREQEKK